MFPYIRKLSKTINTSLYEIPIIEDLLFIRGIKQNNESIQEVFSRVIENLLVLDTKLNNNKIDSVFTSKVIKSIETKDIILSTPLITNIGRNHNPVGACTVLKPYSTNGEFNSLSFQDNAKLMLSAGVGIGYDLSGLNNPISAVKKINEILFEIDDFLKENKLRPSATMLTVRADHPKILDIINIKRNFDFQRSKFNISIFVDESLFRAAKSNDIWYLKNQNDQIEDKIEATFLIKSIASSAHYCGEPGLLYKDRFEKDNPTPHYPFSSTAPCAELAMAENDLCHFGYINLNSLATSKGKNGLGVDFLKLEDSVRIITRLLDSAVQYSIDANPKTTEKIISRRRIGVGVAGFASLLVSLHIPYDSVEAVKLASEISEYIDFVSKSESCNLAKKRGSFPDFEKSQYKDDKWLKRKNANSTGIINAKDWDNLYSSISLFGLRNCSTTAYPPTGTSSRMACISSGIEPYYSLKSNFRDSVSKKLGESYIYSEIYDAIKNKYPEKTKFKEIINQILSNDNLSSLIPITNMPYIKIALQIDSLAHLKILSAFQSFADDGVSKTINLKNNITVEEIESIIWFSYNSNIKGLTVFRNGCLNERS